MSLYRRYFQRFKKTQEFGVLDQPARKGLIRSSFFVFATVIGFVIFGIYLMRVYDGLRETTDKATENSIWVVGQIEPNSLQFKIAMDDYLLNPEDPIAEQQLRMSAGILMSRMDIVKIHISEDRLAVIDELVQDYNSIFSYRPKLLAIARADEGTDTLNKAMVMQMDMNMFIERIRNFAVKTMRLAADKSAFERARLWSTINRFSQASVVLVFMLVASMFMMIFSWNRMIATRSKEAEARESLQKTYDLSSEGIMIVDRMARILTVNPAATEMLNLDESDLLNQNVIDTLYHGEGDPKQFAWNILTKGQHNGITLEHGMTHRTTTRARSKDGTMLDIDLLVARDRDSRGRSVLVLFLRDITEQKARETELRETRDKAVNAVESRIRFFAAMSHEMRTPISGAIAALDAINVRTNPNSDQKRLLSIAEKSAHAALDQINNVLDLAWVERGDFQLDIVEFNYVDVIEEAVDQFRPLAQSVGTMFELELDDRDTSFVRGPLRVFMRPLNNLLGNAIKHTKNGTITIRAAEYRGQVRIEVEDTGSGISEADRERIFEPFIMGDTKQFSATQSSGLGLPIAKRAVESMGGEIGYSSKLGYGTLFWFTCKLETSKTLSERIALPETLKMPALKSEAIKEEVLLVEDNEASRILACEMLEWHGLDVTIAENGREAVEIASSRKFPTILMDVNMPVMDGLAATKIIRKSSKSKDAKIIGVTAYGAPDEVERFLRSGMDDVINKPLTSGNIQSIFTGSKKNNQLSVKDIVGSEKIDSAMDSLRSEVKRLLEGLSSLNLKEEVDEMADEAHRIKGLAAILQLSDLAKQVGQCERLLKDGKIAEARSLTSKIRSAMPAEVNS